MELRSGRRLGRSSPPPPDRRSSSLPMDLISALPDEMLLLVLARLPCVRTAVQTSLLSRRWRGLWMRLTHLTFRGLVPTTIEAALHRYFAASPQISTLDIGLSSSHSSKSANSLLRAAARLFPGHLLFTLQESYMGYNDDIELPCFQGTTSIELDARLLGVKPLLPGDFTTLESLTITGKVVDLRSLLNRCPRLRVLSVSHPDMCFSHTTLPPASEFPALEKLSLSGKIVDLGPLLLNCCKRLRELSVTQRDTRLLDITLPLSGEFPVLEKLSLSGNIADIGTLLNQCPRLRVLGVTFRRMSLDSLEAGLTTLQEMAPLGLVLSLLGVGIPWGHDIDAALLNSLLSTVARLSPRELIFTDNYESCFLSGFDKRVNADLPCFPRVKSMSIWMRLRNIYFKPLPAGEFSALERLSLSGHYDIVDIGTLVARCPCLRVLNVTIDPAKITVHSVSLQELYVSLWHGNMECHCIDIVTPVLKKLDLAVRAASDIGVSISAPAVEKVLWHSSYTESLALLFGSWRLQIICIKTIERSYVDIRDDTCWQQPSRFHVLCLHLNAGNHLDSELDFAEEIEKLPVTNFSVMELSFKYDRHVYGALVLQLLGIRRIRAATKKLKVFLPWSAQKKRPCSRNCPCDKPKNWRSQNIFCTSLEEVEIYGFNGEDHEHDFLRLIFTCSPMLKRLTVRLAESFGGCTTKLSNIFLAHPSVNCCYGHFSSRELVRPASS